jgi:ATP-dependent helicase/nuclease subunit A
MDIIINALPTWAARAFYFAAKTGVRRGGICQLTWDCVNFESKSIKIFSKKGGVTKEINLPMTFDTQSLLLEIWNEKIKSGYNLDFVFLNENGRKILPCTLTKKLASVRESTGIENAGLHIVRHTILTDLSSSNQSGSVIQKVAGHASLTTSQKYVHHKNSDVRQALEKLEREKPLKIPLKIVSGGS